MFLSSYRRPPSAYNRTPPIRQIPSSVVSGTSLSRSRGVKQPDPKPNTTAPQRQPAPVYNRPIQSNPPEPSRTPVLKQPIISSDEDIIIHVCDEAKKIEKDFKCPKSVLITKMKYFESHLQNCQSVDDLEISVHCDVDIFEWLMQYMNNREKPELEMNKVISILISSEFLQMQTLVSECLEFVSRNLEEVVKLPIDMSCLNQGLLKQLARLANPEQLDDIKDRKDKLVSKLFMKKIEEIMEDENNNFNRCVYCNKLFTNEQHDWMICEKARIFIDFHGNVIAEHVADRNWEFNKFMLYLKDQGLSWREIYWKIWARLVSFNCMVCGLKFIGAELGHCSFHPDVPRFSNNSNIGFYQCCQQKAIRFDTSIKKKGCCGRNHVPRQDQIHSKEYEILMKNFSLLEEPFEIKSDRPSLYKLIQQFVSKADNQDCESEDDLDEDERIETEETAEEVKEEERRYKKKGKSSDMSPKKQRVWRLDQLRLNDFMHMKELTANLSKLRRKNNQKSPVKKK
ncbi:unnamed protein product [Blepharisma stoltei]|uniref:SANT and BTB domain-containing protein n=1 Tax=Blepharisma stoltei TaxID=1481888 RepID=A0AAU9JVR5_9CILI|nr:unnamed protein product [Blepharisma stoltei]